MLNLRVELSINDHNLFTEFGNNLSHSREIQFFIREEFCEIISHCINKCDRINAIRKRRIRQLYAYFLDLPS